MNQILATKIQKNISKKLYYKGLFLLSIILIIISVIISINRKIKINNEIKLSNDFYNNYSLFNVYTTKKDNTNSSEILGYISIPKISVNYPFFSDYTEELLKISPCRFYGKMPEEPGNLCITGHNYNDDRFFSRLNELSNNDLIIIENNEKNKFYYYVYDKYEVDSNDISPIEYNEKNSYILTLITCNNYNKKRIIIKARKTIENT